MPEPVKTLRDEFAIAALQACTNGTVQPTKTDRQRAARLAFQWADEMLAARDIDPAQLALLR